MMQSALYAAELIEDFAALIHDIGKPDCQCAGKKEDDINMHYYGHPAKSAEIVRNIVIPQLESAGEKLSDDEKRRLTYYVEYHDDRISHRIKHLKRHLQKASFEEFQNLMHLQVADALAHVQIPVVKERIEICSLWLGEYGRQKYAELLSVE